jgi:sarcosine oxidase, subunit beta
VAPSGRDDLADVAIIGAGVVGLSIACHLAERGIQVVLVERTGIAAGASGIQPGGVRQQWATRINCLLARESVGFYREIGERLGTRLRPRFSACGYAFVAHTDERLAELAANVRLQEELGIPSVLLTPSETAVVVPDLDPSSIRGAAWCPEDGYFDRAQEPVEAFAEAARARGVVFVAAEVVGLEANGGAWRLRGRAGAVATAEQVVVAAACDTVTILRSLDLDLPIVPESRFLFLSNPIGERLLEPLVVAGDIGLAAKQLADGRVLASDLRAEGEPGDNAAHWLRSVRTGIEALLPRLQAVSFPHLISGLYDVTPDHNPFVGAVPGFDRLWVAAGFSGHGFMIAPALGRLLAAALTGGGAALLPAEFRLDRFEHEQAGAETQIV